MERKVFAEGLEKLSLNFGISDSGSKWERRIAFLYDQLRDFPDDVWEAGIKDMLHNMTRFPSLSEMLKCLLSKRSNMIDTCEIIEYPDCKLCDNTGYITTVKILIDEDKKEKATNTYVFRCNCELGQSHSGRIPTWNDFWADKGHQTQVIYDENNQA